MKLAALAMDLGRVGFWNTAIHRGCEKPRRHQRRRPGSCASCRGGWPAAADQHRSGTNPAGTQQPNQPHLATAVAIKGPTFTVTVSPTLSADTKATRAGSVTRMV